MAKQIIREFAPAERYVYDFGACTSANGWAQVDTEQDASYFGTWASPSRLEVFTYCEGDTTLVRLDSAEEFAAELREIDRWNQEQGYKPVKIDGMCNDSLIEQFSKIGLADMLH